jgi:hypothetical protein
MLLTAITTFAIFSRRTITLESIMWSLWERKIRWAENAGAIHQTLVRELSGGTVISSY